MATTGSADPTQPQYYTWDAWNRLTAVRDAESNVVAVYVYDGQMRRIRKAVATETRDTIYDGWNVLYDAATFAGGACTTNTYVWGLDLSGSLPEASRRILEAVERQKIAAALAETGGDRARAAELLGVPFNTLVGRFGQYRLN